MVLNGLFGVTGPESQDIVDGAERPVSWNRAAKLMSTMRDCTAKLAC